MSIGQVQVYMTRIFLWALLFAGAVALAGERIRIGAEDDWSPYSSVSKGKPVGFAVDVVRAAWAASGVDVELVPLPYARCMKEVDRGLLAGCFDTLHDPILEYGTAGTLSRSFGRVLVSMGGWAMCWCLTA